MRLEAIHQAAVSPSRDTVDDVNNRKSKYARGVTGSDKSDKSAVTAVLAKLNNLQQRFDSELKTIRPSSRMPDVESAVKRPQPRNEFRRIGNVAACLPNSDPSVPTTAFCRRPPQHVSSAGTPAYSYNRSVPTSAAAPRACYQCGDLTHLVSELPVASTRCVRSKRQSKSCFC